VGSFSKVMAPGFRAGWLIVPEELVKVLGCAKDGADIDTSTFSQRLVSAYLEAGGFEAHLGRIRAAYRRAARRHAGRAGPPLPRGDALERAAHGALLWAELPAGMDAAALLPSCWSARGWPTSPGTPSASTAAPARAGCG
jgi:2-aminoadipate transaminase